jgi:hypothetical protein
MNTQLKTIARRRAVLVARAAAQRDEIGRVVRPWQTPLAFMDRGVALVRRVRTHPLGIAIGVLLLLRLVRGPWSAWAGRLWTGWQLYQSLQNQQWRRQRG